VIADPTILAEVLVPAPALAIGLRAAYRDSPGVRALLFATAVMISVAIVLTLSRGGLLALGFILFLSALLVGRKRHVAIGIGFVVLLITILYFGVLATPAARERVTHVNGASGRLDLWKIGGRMFEANPIKGVGIGNFPTSSVHYLLDPGEIQRSDIILDQPKPAHNTYLQLFDEEGIVGGTMFIGIALVSLVCIGKAIREFSRLGDEPMEFIARALLVGISAALLYSLFLTTYLNKQEWLLLALGPALLGVARRERAAAVASPQDADYRGTEALAPPPA
jgi:O-antigen ligase